MGKQNAFPPCSFSPVTFQMKCLMGEKGRDGINNNNDEDRLPCSLCDCLLPFCQWHALCKESSGG